MDTQMIVTILVLFGGIIYTTGMATYRKYVQGEEFDPQKYMMTFGYTAALTAAAYLTTGYIPAFDTILEKVMEGLPDSEALYLLISTLVTGVLHQLLKKGGVVPTTTTTTTTTTEPAATTTPVTATAPATTAPATPTTVTSTAPATAEPQWFPGISVTPTKQNGVSPCKAQFTVTVGTESEVSRKRCMVQFDWMDGSPLELFKADENLGTVVVDHVFKYVQGDTPYTGHNFYPEVSAMSADGTKQLQTINTDGRAFWVYVQASK
jgi:hypothetical protein